MNLATNNAQTIWDTIGHKQYQLENHLGNVLATITDKRAPHSTNGTTIDYYMPEVTTAQEYFAFGFAIPYRNYTLSQPYRYGFNGKENDNQVKLDWSGNGIPGAQQDYGERIYDPRVGRFFSVDPIAKQYPELTPYQFASNTPIQAKDIDGEGADFSSAKVNLIEFNGIQTQNEKNVIFIVNTVKIVYNGVIDAAELVSNENPVYNLADHGRGFEKIVNNGTKTVKGTYNWIVNSTWHDKAEDLIDVSRNPHTYESIAALAITHKFGEISPLVKADAPIMLEEDEVIAKGNLSKAERLAINNKISKESESIVRSKLTSQLGDNEILIEKPRIYIEGGKGTYAVPDFAIYDRETKQITKIVEAKNGNAELTNAQKALDEKGGRFRGSSRYNKVKSQNIKPNSIKIERTNVGG